MLHHLTHHKYYLSYEQKASYRALVNLGLNNADFVTKSVYDEERDMWTITLNQHAIINGDFDVELSITQIPSVFKILEREESDEDGLSYVLEDVLIRLNKGLYNVNDAVGFLEVACYGNTEQDDFYGFYAY